MALDLQAILNEAVSEVLKEDTGDVLEKAKRGLEDVEKEVKRKLEDVKDKVTGEDSVLDKAGKAIKRGLEDVGTEVKRAVEDHPYAAAATGALAAGAGALGLRKLIQKARQKKVSEEQ